MSRQLASRYTVLTTRVEALQITGALGPDMLQKLLSLLVVPSLVDCTNKPSQTKPKSLCNRQSDRFSVKILASLPLLRNLKIFFFAQSPNLLSVAVDISTPREAG